MPRDFLRVGWAHAGGLMLSPLMGHQSYRATAILVLAFEFGKNSHFLSLARCPFRINLNTLSPLTLVTAQKSRNTSYVSKL
jgi:hypothetical protein